MRLAVAPVSIAAACGAPQGVDRDPVVPPCTRDRIGAVRVIGAARTVVPALAVLEGTLDDPDRTARIAQVATEALQWRGYARAQIHVTRRPGCFVDLDVAVTLGPRYTIGRIAFATDDDFPAARRLAALEDALGTVNTVGGVLIEYRLARALHVLARRYRDAGWLDVEIGAPVTAYTNDAVEVTIPITAGPRYRVGAIRALGGDARARARLLDELGIAPGAWYDGPAIRRALEGVRRTLDRTIKLRASALEDRALIELEAIVR